jgi:mannose-1-phosphate guanylyltransferase
MLEHTLLRAEKLIPREHLFTVVSQDHLRYPEVRQQLSGRLKGTVIVQPQNKDTGPGILLPLMYLHKRYPESVVVVFPSDHFIREEDQFLAYVGLAFHAVERDASRVVLLGIEPDGPEPEYGYILPDGHLNNLKPLGVHKVRLFIEKPEPHAAQELVLRGGLWNTMVLVFTKDILLDLARSVAPVLCHSFERIWEAIGTRSERYVVEEVYRCMQPVNFSKGILEPLLQHRSHLSVLPVPSVFWSDWGLGQRVVNNLRKTGYLGRLNGVSEEQLFRIWGGLDAEDPR